MKNTNNTKINTNNGQYKNNKNKIIQNNQENEKENEDKNKINSEQQSNKGEEKGNNNVKLKENDLYDNILYKSDTISPNNNYILNRNSSINNITNNLNLNLFPLSRDNSTTYIKKKSSNMKIHNNENNNSIKHSTRTSIFKNNNKYSISQSCYNTQRKSDSKISIKNKNNEYWNYLYSPKNNKLDNKTIIVPEYKVKLENIKSRISNLLNVYSLLALKNINIIYNNNNYKEIEKKEDIRSNNNEC